MLVNLFFALTVLLFKLSFRLRVASTRLETNSRIIPAFTAKKLKTLRIIEQMSETREFCIVRNTVQWVLQLCVFWSWTRIFCLFYNWTFIKGVIEINISSEYYDRIHINSGPPAETAEVNTDHSALTQRTHWPAIIRIAADKTAMVKYARLNRHLPHSIAFRKHWGHDRFPQPPAEKNLISVVPLAKYICRQIWFAADDEGCLTRSTFVPHSLAINFMWPRKKSRFWC